MTGLGSPFRRLKAASGRLAPGPIQLCHPRVCSCTVLGGYNGFHHDGSFAEDIINIIYAKFYFVESATVVALADGISHNKFSCRCQVEWSSLIRENIGNTKTEHKDRTCLQIACCILICIDIILTLYSRVGEQDATLFFPRSVLSKVWYVTLTLCLSSQGTQRIH